MGALFWILIALLSTTCSAENLRVLVLLSNSNTPYQTFANTLIHNLPASTQTTVLEQSENSPIQTQADLIVAVGMKAAQTATTQSSSPVLAVMITKVGYAELLAQNSPQKRSQFTSAIYLDQPWARQIDFIQAVLPKHNRIGLLYTPNAHIDLAYLRQQVVERGVTVIAKPALSPEKVFSTLDDLLENVDVLLALPDNTIYNSINIRNILLSTYRAGIPFVGLSQSYVTAGAVGAVFTSPEQMADQVAASILSFARSGKLPALQYPRDFTILLNTEVARSLGIDLPSINLIRQRMDSANRGVP